MKKVYAVLCLVFCVIGITLFVTGLILTDGESSKRCFDLGFCAALVATVCCMFDSYYKLVDRVSKLEETSNRSNE